jgi:hypothetical protein
MLENGTTQNPYKNIHMTFKILDKINHNKMAQ